MYQIQIYNIKNNIFQNFQEIPFSFFYTKNIVGVFFVLFCAIFKAWQPLVTVYFFTVWKKGFRLT